MDVFAGLGLGNAYQSGWRGRGRHGRRAAGCAAGSRRQATVQTLAPGGEEIAKQKESIRSELDLYDRLNSTTSVEQIGNARSVVERLRDDRWRYFEAGSKPFDRWKEGCDELYQLGFVDVCLSNDFRVQIGAEHRRAAQLHKENSIRPWCPPRPSAFLRGHERSSACPSVFLRGQKERCSPRPHARNSNAGVKLVCKQAKLSYKIHAESVH